LAEINDEIASLKEVIAQSKVSVKQEKDIVQKISQLENLLPFATQYDNMKKVTLNLCSIRNLTRYSKMHL
jgi:uncharacterized coiled-coil DUF342 family protein